jgi:hypothetical protein
MVASSNVEMTRAADGSAGFEQRRGASRGAGVEVGGW